MAQVRKQLCLEILAQIYKKLNLDKIMSYDLMCTKSQTTIEI